MLCSFALLFMRERDACVSCPWKQASTFFLPSPLLVHSPSSHSYLKFPNTKQVKGDVPFTSGHSIFEVYSNIRYTYTSIIANCSLLSQCLHIRHEPQWLHAISSHKCFLYKYKQVLLVAYNKPRTESRRCFAVFICDSHSYFTILGYRQ